MGKEMNHRVVLYFVSALTLFMLLFIYMDVQKLNGDVDNLLERTQQDITVDVIERIQRQYPEIQISEADTDDSEVLIPDSVE